MLVHFIRHEGEILAVFPFEPFDRSGLVMSYALIGQHGGASPDLLKACPHASYAEYRPLLLELIKIGYSRLELVDQGLISYHRKPTPGENRRGYGATHYADFEAHACINRKGRIKKWLKSNVDGLRYYR